MFQYKKRVPNQNDAWESAELSMIKLDTILALNSRVLMYTVLPRLYYVVYS